MLLLTIMAFPIMVGSCVAYTGYGLARVTQDTYHSNVRQAAEAAAIAREKAARCAAERLVQAQTARDRCEPIVHLYCRHRGPRCETKPLEALCLADASVNTHNYRDKLRRWNQKANLDAAHERRMIEDGQRQSDWLGL